MGLAFAVNACGNMVTTLPKKVVYADGHGLMQLPNTSNFPDLERPLINVQVNGSGVVPKGTARSRRLAHRSGSVKVRLPIKRWAGIPKRRSSGVTPHSSFHPLHFGRLLLML